MMTLLTDDGGENGLNFDQFLSLVSPPLPPSESRSSPASSHSVAAALAAVSSMYMPRADACRWCSIARCGTSARGNAREQTHAAAAVVVVAVVVRRMARCGEEMGGEGEEEGRG